MSQKTWQGDQGVLTAALHYSRLGWTVSTPITEHTKYDLIVDTGEALFRVQVKSTGYNPTGTGCIAQLRTNGANYSTKNKHTRIEENNVDLVFILTQDGDCYEFPSKDVAGMASVTLGKKYREYKVGTYAPICAADV